MNRAVRRAVIALLGVILCVPAAVPAGRDDVAAPLRQFIDGFNSGDTKSAFAAYASSGPITIIDEFAPHLWSGPDAARVWAEAYDKHAQATGVSDGKVTYSQPTRAEIEGELAYVILPTVYVYKEHGKPLKEEGQITAVLVRETPGWKIRAWTWSGVKPHAAK